MQTLNHAADAQGPKKILTKKQSQPRRKNFVTYSLPDKQKIQIKEEFASEINGAEELFFQPSKVGLQQEGLSKMLTSTLATAPYFLHHSLIHNVYH